MEGEWGVETFVRLVSEQDVKKIKRMLWGIFNLWGL